MEQKSNIYDLTAYLLLRDKEYSHYKLNELQKGLVYEVGKDDHDIKELENGVYMNKIFDEVKEALKMIKRNRNKK